MRRTFASILGLAAAAFLTTMAHGQEDEEVCPPTVPLMLPAGSEYGQSFVRLINKSDQAGEAYITAIDDGGNAYQPITVQLAANQVFHFNSNDLTDGNASKGIGSGIGAPIQGNWRLSIKTKGCRAEVLSFIRTSDGFLTLTHPNLSVGSHGRLSKTFNPASNKTQQSRLRLINCSAESETLRIEGTDDTGTQHGPVSLTLPAGQARMLTAIDLEEGADGLEGTLGDGTGKWRLDIRADVDSIAAQSLLYASSGHISNLSAIGVPTFEFSGSCGSSLPSMVRVPAGSFTMGAPEGEVNSEDDERPQRTVSIPAFAVSAHEVTFAQWDSCVAGGGCPANNPDEQRGERGAGWDERWGRGNRPVINVSWDDAQHYISWLSHCSGDDYRLLTESEWEYAARAGTTTPFHTGGTITTEQANYDGRYNYPSNTQNPSGLYRYQTVPVGSFAPNAFGLYDMHGNVREWVQDCYHDYADAPSDGSAAACGAGSALGRVMRGGSWSDFPWYLRSASRTATGSGNRGDDFGFRVAQTLPETD